MRKRKSVSTFGLPGVSLLIMIFAVLCISVFSAMALSAVNTETKMTEKNLENTEEFYLAESYAHEMLAELRQQNIEGVREINVPINESQNLVMTVELRGCNYEIKNFETVYTANWETDDTLNVWPGN